MKTLAVLAAVLIVLSGCGGSAQTNPSVAVNPNLQAPAPRPSISPITDDIGLVLNCNKCVFVEEKGMRYVAGQIQNNAKQALSGYVMAIDFQDAKGQSVKNIPGLMLMNVMTLQVGEKKDFKEQIFSSEANVTQAVVFFKRAGKDVKLSDVLTLRLDAPTTAAPIKRKRAVQTKQ